MKVIDILVIGSTPTGLTAAAEALRHGLSVQIIDPNENHDTYNFSSRAPILQCRTMELLHAMGNGCVTNRLLEQGKKITAWNIHIGQSSDVDTFSTLNLPSLPWGDTNYPYYLSLPQHNMEQILQHEIEALGGTIEWGKSVSKITQDKRNDFVESTLVLPDGSQEIVRSRWMIGCDGRDSKTREKAGIQMSENSLLDANEQMGLTFRFEQPKKVFVIADFKTKNESFSQNAITAFLHPEGICSLIPLPEQKSFWFFAEAPSDFTEHQDTAIDEAFLNNLISSRTGVDVNCYDVGRTTSFKVSYNVAKSYRKDRIFLAGEACYYHSLAEGQGMNFGIQDAMNLIWKLAWVKRLEHSSSNQKKLTKSILNSYEAERKPQLEFLLTGTIISTLTLLSRNKTVQSICMMVFPHLLQTSFIQEQMSRGSGMLNLKYAAEQSPIILSPPLLHAFSCVPGQRLPNFCTFNNKRVYDVIDRDRHSWVEIHPNEESARDQQHICFGPEGLHLVHAWMDERERQETGTDENAIDLSAIFGRPDQKHAILVRPDLYIAAIGSKAQDVMKKYLKLVGRDVGSSL